MNREDEKKHGQPKRKIFCTNGNKMIIIYWMRWSAFNTITGLHELIDKTTMKKMTPNIKGFKRITLSKTELGSIILIVSYAIILEMATKTH